MRGILGWGVHLPYRRLDRTAIAPVAGTGGGTGTRAVASYDEDTTTMAVAAARAALQAEGSNDTIRTLWLTTTAPAYQDRTNATAVHAALRLPRTTAAYDATGAVRSTIGALEAGLTGTGTHLVVASDLRTGRPGSADESAGGDAAAALVIGDGTDNSPVLAELLGHTSTTEEFLDRWRTPGDQTSKTWEDRFGENRYTTLATEAWNALLVGAEKVSDDIDILLIAGTHERAAKSALKKTGVPAARHHDPFSKTVGNSGAAHPALLIASALEVAQPGQTIALLVLADGADAFLWRATEALAAYRPARPVADQLAASGGVPYGRYLAWRGFLPVEPPRRPEPARTSASAAARAADWKFALVGTESADGAIVHLPPSSFDAAPHPAAGSEGTIVTFTVDRLAYSPSPPVVFAVVDFDGGGRLPIELTDVDADEVAIGLRVEATFRRLSSADGIHNYFWKARPVRHPERETR
ncbi:OB-fold domain-containing protein [Catenulispora rubra]|uniref:OB-fold domain-containing protein n=1 Tax=Catenulispora rubra TaxID=280293 RepID=UPI00189282B6|nr:OB-fold domain-containing protein [Catenulispora rubra]